MSQYPFEQAGGLVVGTVDFVSPDEIKVALDTEAPESMALNPGTPRPFPRVNGYLLVAVDDGFLVGQVEWLTVERSPFPTRRGFRDFGLVDLPYPLRRLRLNPLGVLNAHVDGGFSFKRGIQRSPTIGASVLLPTDAQLRSVIESGDRRRVRIGTNPMASNAEVCVDPDRLFGRHLAVLGNTGSGKSCTVAGLIRWSLEAAERRNRDLLHMENGKTKDLLQRPHARFVILDPNGEYSRAFASNDPIVAARIFKVGGPTGDGVAALKVPIWFWNSSEWGSFARASPRTQQPLLRRALREVKVGRTGVSPSTRDEAKLALRRYLSSRLVLIRGALGLGQIQGEATRFGFLLRAISADLESKAIEFPSAQLPRIQTAIRQALEATYGTFRDKATGDVVEFYRAFQEGQVVPVIERLEESIETLGGIVYHDGPSEDVPIPFRGTDLADHLEVLAVEGNVTQFVDFLVARIRTLLADTRMQAIVDDTDGMSLEEWLESYVGADEARDGCVSVIDLSLVPSEVIHVVIAVTTRMIFEALQRYRKRNANLLPTVLVMEEAHTFIRRYKDEGDHLDAARVCCQAFERVAREGRKFGLGLVLSSQRPSELSPTVLSQCNTFLLHRISNDRDQDMVNRLVPDSLRGILRELPSLPSQAAVLLGWATELPTLVRIRDLPKEQQPHSDDPDYWKVWTGQRRRVIDWADLAREWAGLEESRQGNEDEVGGGRSGTDDGETRCDDELPF